MRRCLLVIDVQNDYFPGGALPLWQAQETEARILAEMARCRADGREIVLVRHESTAATGLFAAGSAGSAIRPAILAAAPDAPVVTKRHADAFQDTTLGRHLSGIADVLVCGMMTQNCVTFTAMSELAGGVRLRVAGELCTAPTEIVHRVALNALLSKGRIVSCGDVEP
ncbi:MAG: isochorismatase family protein [Rhodobacteraceae bacterium]|nr:isochorismatase family protein [Paracoccaceae bacterium]